MSSRYPSASHNEHATNTAPHPVSAHPRHARTTPARRSPTRRPQTPNHPGREPVPATVWAPDTPIDPSTRWPTALIGQLVAALTEPGHTVLLLPPSTAEQAQDGAALAAAEDTIRVHGRTARTLNPATPTVNACQPETPHSSPTRDHDAAAASPPEHGQTPPASVELILTDLAPHEADCDTVDSLAATAAGLLAPGGLLVVLTPHHPDRWWVAGPEQAGGHRRAPGRAAVSPAPRAATEADPARPAPPPARQPARATGTASPRARRRPPAHPATHPVTRPRPSHLPISPCTGKVWHAPPTSPAALPTQPPAQPRRGHTPRHSSGPLGLAHGPTQPSPPTPRALHPRLDRAPGQDAAGHRRPRHPALHTTW